ncbi:ABC transporter ATP-binding protein [Anabaena cylindrica FACHB-243]|uniref:Xenobiotic-transporting ATPase n=1 Tax=Anabaena cylindrica (strain ATCC 27899 / PCC 7122) TaxID=272123 RepID=K9ZQX9_ANACC|nr:MULTISPECIES: ABC transporter ATP-binding protein [Anabaena]AFZ60745.1 Xenobiotic-transporting ATPase [Anabaena cylindrica PCC 7122]MBD2419820.1 ABC transporter ATP-binding protein [Anabaena cylindrica FACHB-243]MBY5281319.1 ABC transporter ATP-binding protein [Anabaena sp. CCAP 1446/1C]MBY5309031.1 ABC transporter ATP-binding protein [Anabaena sp. CCAP 1446/1C]MCM2406745.1 ABC transporter ATP-binding protein/permease [Anabaena sp. CCAP 1446/1C]
MKIKKRNVLRQSLTVFRYSGRAINLVWTTSRSLTILLASLTLVAGLLPAAISYIGKLIVDAVVSASLVNSNSNGFVNNYEPLLYVGLEAIAIILLAGSQRGIIICQSLLRALLGQRVNVLILEKALTLDLRQFEDSEFYDKLTNARREASVRPLSLVTRTFGLVQNALSLITYGILLVNFSVWAVVMLIVAAMPVFIAETKFAGEAFRLFSWRAPETRQQHYLENLLAREDFATEVKLYQLGEMLLGRYHNLFAQLYRQDRDLTLRRGLWGYLLSLVSTAAFYIAYAWIVLETVVGRISLGDMTMYLTVFRQGQSTFANALTSIGGMYEDNLYLSNLYDFLEEEVPTSSGHATTGFHPQDGIRFENVSFTYPGSSQPALRNISLHLQPGEKLAIVGENGSGKTTLIKLLTRLYTPDSGRILLDGLDLQEWDVDVLRRRIGVIFQNFVRYQFTVGENIGVGDIEHLENKTRWQTAAQKGMAAPFIDQLPESFQTQLGRWFKGGQELSGGQWQKIALSRAFMRSQADILVLDEPTSAIDAQAEFEIFNHFRAITQHQMVLLISHRFSTVRMADKIAVIEDGVVVELGTHDELIQAGGRYAKLFLLQAAGYR